MLQHPLVSIHVVQCGWEKNKTVFTGLSVPMHLALMPPEFILTDILFNCQGSYLRSKLSPSPRSRFYSLTYLMINLPLQQLFLPSLSPSSTRMEASQRLRVNLKRTLNSQSWNSLSRKQHSIQL